jgi:hypothetical protein
MIGKVFKSRSRCTAWLELEDRGDDVFDKSLMLKNNERCLIHFHI